jgi:hypothetical protein
MEIFISRTFQKEIRSLSAPIKVRIIAIIDRLRLPSLLLMCLILKLWKGHNTILGFALGIIELVFTNDLIML